MPTMKEISEQAKEERELRDKFAMAALTGMAGDKYLHNRTAKLAYEYADAMLKERRKTND